jgi:hypothetical protein
MKTFALVVIASAAALAGCSAKRLQDPDGGGTGTIGRDGGTSDIHIATDGGGGALDGGGGGALDGGGATDAGTLFPGRRSFVVTSTVTPVGSGEGGGVFAHTFTMTVDGEQLIAISGASSSVTVSPVQPAAGGFRLLGSLVFVDPTNPGCGGALTYENLTFTFDAGGGLLGSASGTRTTVVGDVGNPVRVTISMTGAADRVVPALGLLTSEDITDPFASFSVIPSEPLPEQAVPVLRSSGGDAVALTSFVAPGGGALYEFFKPPVVLRFGEQYRVDVGAGVADFAGNLLTGTNLTFTTRAAPPLIAADGFESATGATLGGAQVLSGAGDPIINGTHSLYVPPATLPPTAPVTQLALRLSVVPGSTMLRFAYQLVNPTTVPNAYFWVGSVGGMYAIAAPTPGGPGATTVGPTTPATIGGSQVALGPVATATVDLPGGTTGEIVIERVTLGGNCGAPSPPPAGIIIDDLRTE